MDDPEVNNGVNLSKLVHIGLAYGKDVDNEPNTIIYIDDMAFTESDGMTSLSNGTEMPRVFPQHWPFGSVAATAWLIFAELETNPFVVNCEFPPKPFFKPRADLNEDCWVDQYDLIALGQQWLQTGGNPLADIAPDEGDGKVNLLDLAVVAELWLHYGM